MMRILSAALVLTALGPASLAGRGQGQGEGEGEGKKPDRIIEILREGGKIVFREQGRRNDKGKPRAVGVVVGETVRWVNRDAEPHTLRSVAKHDDKPLFDTQAIGPGQHKDVAFNIDMYRALAGRPARYVSVKYQSGDRADQQGELIFMSAARN